MKINDLTQSKLKKIWNKNVKHKKTTFFTFVCEKIYMVDKVKTQIYYIANPNAL